MNFWYFVWKNSWKKPLASILTLALFALGTTLILSVSSAKMQMEEQVKKNLAGVDMIVGAKGSPLQLVLSSLFHIDFPTGNIKLSILEKVIKNPLVKDHLPLSMGDNYQGFRIIGTEENFLNWFSLNLKEGKSWDSEFEAVVGSTVARDLGLKIGDEFHSAHGFESEGMDHDHEHIHVVGILEESGTANDVLIFVSTSTVWGVHGLGKDEESEVTAALIRFRNPGGVVSFPRTLKRFPEIMAVSPSFEVNRLFLVFKPLGDFLKILAWVIMGISSLSIVFSLWNTMKERNYEIALVRVLGGSRQKVFVSMILEGLLLSVQGFLIGLILSWFTSQLIFQLALPGFQREGAWYSFSEVELFLFFWVLFLGLASAAIPAFVGSRQNISKVLFSR